MCGRVRQTLHELLCIKVELYGRFHSYHKELNTYITAQKKLTNKLTVKQCQKKWLI